MQTKVVEWHYNILQNTQFKLPCPRATHLIIVIALNNSHAARSKTDLLMSFTCNKGQRTLSTKELNKT